MPLIYTGPADIVDQMVEVYRGAVPADLASTDRQLDDAIAIAEIMTLAEGQAMGWAREAHLGTSHGIWTDQHGRDRDTTRAAGETDDSFRSRLRTSPRAVIEESIEEAIAAVIATTGAVGSAAAFYLVAIPVTHGAFCGTDAWCDADSRVTPTGTRVTIALIPAALGIRAAVLEALRSKMPAGHAFGVEEF